VAAARSRAASSGAWQDSDGGGGDDGPAGGARYSLRHHGPAPRHASFREHQPRVPLPNPHTRQSARGHSPPPAAKQPMEKSIGGEMDAGAAGAGPSDGGGGRAASPADDSHTAYTTSGRRITRPTSYAEDYEDDFEEPFQRRARSERGGGAAHSGGGVLASERSSLTVVTASGRRVQRPASYAEAADDGDFEDDEPRQRRQPRQGQSHGQLGARSSRRGGSPVEHEAAAGGGGQGSTRSSRAVKRPKTYANDDGWEDNGGEGNGKDWQQPPGWGAYGRRATAGGAASAPGRAARSTRRQGSYREPTSTDDEAEAAEASVDAGHYGGARRRSGGSPITARLRLGGSAAAATASQDEDPGHDGDAGPNGQPANDRPQRLKIRLRRSS